MIHIKNLTVAFRNKVILNNLHLHVRPQEAFALIGPSGAGKSTFLKTVAGLIEPTQGEITLNSSKMSMLFQKNALFDSFSLLDNLLVPLEETLGIVGSEAEDRAMALLDAVGLKPSAHLFPDEISGGMQKRLGIARALIVEPDIILYDEPTAGLDPITSKTIADLMLELHEKNKTTLVMVTNDLQRAYQVADRIAFCDEGTFQFIGTPEEVKNTTHSALHRFIYSMGELLGQTHRQSHKEPIT